MSLLNPISEIVRKKGSIPCYEYVSLALYHEQWGYYRREANRVGHNDQSDFFTASSLGSVFSSLVLGAIQVLLKDQNLADYHFVEIGSEKGRSIADEWEKSPFKSHIAIGSSDSLDELNGKCVVFSNELLDAQSFCRFRYYENKGWKEMGITCDEDGLKEIPLGEYSSAGKQVEQYFQEPTTNGYTLDFPLGAELLLKKIVEMPWKGLWLAMDYGKDWRSLYYEMPHGSARTYSKHNMGDDITVTPGEIDITHHVCWDHLEEILKGSGFNKIDVLRQESFFMRYAHEEIERIMSQAGVGYEKDKGTLMELLHPGNMGAKFQVLSGIRE